jgi:hypothetical protein
VRPVPFQFGTELLKLHCETLFHGRLSVGKSLLQFVVETAIDGFDFLGDAG